MGRSSARCVNEQCWVLVGSRRGPIWYARQITSSAGDPARVEFDGLRVLAREERRRDVVGFYHTHPTFPASPSARDVRTLQAWVSAFGKPLLCVIEGTDGLRAWRFDDDRSTGIPLRAIEQFARGVLIGVDHDGGKVSSRRAVSRRRRG